LSFFEETPLAVVVALPTFFQLPDTRRWILTGTPASHAVNVSAALTTPLATRCFLSVSVTLLEWMVLTTKSAVLVAEPTGVMTLIFPVVAVAGTVAVICVAELIVNSVALGALNFTERREARPR
jgi:hypothetical protein